MDDATKKHDNSVPFTTCVTKLFLDCFSQEELDQIRAEFMAVFAGVSYLVINLKGTLERHKAAAAVLAEAGWTLPDWISMSEVQSLSCKSQDEIDAYLTEGYMENAAKNLDDLHERLLKCDPLSAWFSLIDEIFASIKAKRHLVTIPATLTIIDGFVANVVVSLSLANKQVTNPVKCILKAGLDDNIEEFEALKWIRASIFLEKLFATSDFNKQCPDFINRHWILHGRSLTDWKLADAIRLVNALSAITFLSEPKYEKDV